MSKIPEPATPEGYFIPTLNQSGFMSAWVSDEFMKGFISFAPHARGPLLDVGAAYGVATLPALANGATVLANDSSLEQLQILFEQAPIAHRSRLTLVPGIFPDHLSLESNTVGAILIARVLHFFDGDTIRRSIARCYDWLIPGGRIFITAETPYLKNLQSFIPEYESRCSAGSEWPGFISDFSKWDIRKGVNLPDQMHLMDENVLCRELKSSGFNILVAKKFARPEFPEALQLDGRESVGVIAEKV